MRAAALRGLGLAIWPREQAPAYYDALLAICHERGLEPEVRESTERLLGPRSYLLRTGAAFALVPADFALEAPPSLASAPLVPPATIPLELAWRAPLTRGAEQVVRAVARLTR